MSAARVAERTVAAGRRVHSARLGVGRHRPPSRLGGAGVRAARGCRGGGRLRHLVARGPSAPILVAGGRGHRHRPTPLALGAVRANTGTPRTCRSTRRDAGCRVRGTPQCVGDVGGPLPGRMRDGSAYVPRGPGAEPPAGDGGPMGPDGSHGGRSGLRGPLAAMGPAARGDRTTRTPQQPCPTADRDGDALSRGGTPGASCRVCRRRSPDPGGLCTSMVKPAPRTEKVAPS